MSALFNYSTSPLNLGLKIITTMLFFLVTIIYYDASAKYSGEIQNFITFLLGFAAFITMATLFRCFGHGACFGFDENCSLKWFMISWLM
ncbi:MAG: hypothetical protein JXA98_07975, partial [Methanosarcinaceae archaeon]|nr:hypothetical protein [Methanosarcinaceae archaeon]